MPSSYCSLAQNTGAEKVLQFTHNSSIFPIKGMANAMGTKGANLNCNARAAANGQHGNKEMLAGQEHAALVRQFVNNL
jgi:hypothetical protein